MPAIQLERLRKQVAELIERYHQPVKFAQGLADLFEYYADRTQRRNPSKARSLVIKNYRVPAVVKRRVLQGLNSSINSDPAAALLLVDELWRHEVLEFRTLAIDILGQSPPELCLQVIDRVKAWNHQNNEILLLEMLADQALTTVRSQAVEDVFQLVHEFVTSDHMIDQRLGVRVLLPLVGDPSFENLPAIFALLKPLMKEIPAPLRPDLLDILCLLAKRTPQETALFLRQIFNNNEAQHNFSWLLRRVMPYFPQDIQHNLSTLLR